MNEEKNTLQQIEDEITKRQNAKTQSINIRIAPAVKADTIRKASELDLNISEYIEFVLSKEEDSNLRVLKERRQGEELKEAYENKVSTLAGEFETLQNEKANLNERADKLTNVIFVERIRNAENEKNTLQFINLMKEAIISAEEMRDQLDFFTQNRKLTDIFALYSGQEFTYYSNGNKETLTPETIEDIFTIIVSDFHSKLGLHEVYPEVEAV